MNNWLNKHSQELFTRNDERVEAIPVSALEELKSNDGEQLAREMYPSKSGIPFLCDTGDIARFKQQSFLEAYNLQEVKMAEFKEEVKKWFGDAQKELNEKLALWAENEALKKEVEELRDALNDLVQLKNWKEKYGKDEHYLKNLTSTWNKAKRIIYPQP